MKRDDVPETYFGDMRLNGNNREFQRRVGRYPSSAPDWQPWASLIADGPKIFETRSWKTKYRGPLLICAAKAIICPDMWPELAHRLYRAGGYFPVGKALCVVDLVRVYQTTLLVYEWDHQPGNDDYDPDIQRALGEFSPGRFAWRLENVRKLKPFPVTGRQGLFNVDDRLIEEAMKAA